MFGAIAGGIASALSAGAMSDFFFQAEDGIRDYKVTGVQTCALPILGEQPALRRLVGAEELLERITQDQRPDHHALLEDRELNALDHFTQPRCLTHGGDRKSVV